MQKCILLRVFDGIDEELREISRVLGEVEKIDEMCEKCVGRGLWGVQRTWAKRFLMGESFAVIAPTGVGKTVFGMLISLYTAMKGGRAYILVPTALLAKQVGDRLNAFAERVGTPVRVLSYHSLLPRGEARRVLESIRAGDFDVLVTTSAFLSRRFDLVKPFRFDLVFVDDVDSIVKRSKNVDKVLMLLGFDEQVVSKALRLVELRPKLAKASGSSLEDLRNEFYELEDEVYRYLEENEVGVLIVSGASLRARRTKRIKLFRELLGFELGSAVRYGRNIEDLYVVPEGVVEGAVELVKKLGKGGLVFVPMDLGLSFAREVSKRLEESGVRCVVYDRARKGVLESFRSGEVEVLVGVASYRSPLARGIDLPETVRYVLFVGVPKFKIRLWGRLSPAKAIILLANLRDFVGEAVRLRIDKAIADLRRMSNLLKVGEVERLVEATYSGQELHGFLGRVQKRFKQALSLIEELLSRQDVRKRMEESPYTSLRTADGDVYMLIPDPVAYIQASGRASRLYAGGISKGVSIVLVDDEKAFRSLMRSLEWYLEESRWRSLEEVDLQAVMAEVDRDREFIRSIMEGRISPEVEDLVKTALLVVESPNKARTIARFFGDPSRREVDGLTVYEVGTEKYILSITATGGHIFDLVTHVEDGLYGVLEKDGLFIPVYSTIKRCYNCGETFADDYGKCPTCGSEEFLDKIEVVQALRRLAREVSVVLIGTDPDAEGEKIAWDLARVLEPYVEDVKRIEFHEVTRKALSEALRNPRGIDERLVEAQLVRRVEDRWIGFSLSQKLWKRFGSRTLSAGRVQTPVLGWIIERALQARKKVYCFLVQLENGLTLTVRKRKLEGEQRKIKQGATLTCRVFDVSTSEERLNPPPPYTTDSMLREASDRLRLPVSRIMALAQGLFETGLITYHRTDSTRVSTAGIGVAKRYISERFGEELFAPRTWMAEGAHECIRPTRPIDASRLRQLIAMGIYRPARRLTRDHIRLYDLIFRRFMASQMKPARVVRQRAKVEVKELGVVEEVSGVCEVVERGFTAMRPLRVVPRVSEGVAAGRVLRTWRSPLAPLFTQGEIIALMKERGIGRPSTYAKIIQTLFKRRYIIEVKGRIVPTKLGMEVYEYLKKRYGRYVSEETTRKLEEFMDMIREGAVDYMDVIRTLHGEVLEIIRATD